MTALEKRWIAIVAMSVAAVIIACIIAGVWSGVVNRRHEIKDDCVRYNAADPAAAKRCYEEMT